VSKPISLWSRIGRRAKSRAVFEKGAAMTEPRFYTAIFGDIGMGELLLILFIVMIIFGVGKIPEVGSSLGRAIKNFKDASAGKSEAEKKTDSSESEKKS
jgi:sec-independent protein translocase protein TatA